MTVQNNYYNGILLVDKEEGISSYDVIRRVKPLFPHKHKIGHAGTLDPFASGLLIVLIGKATKLSNSFLQTEKEYTFTARFGYETDTQDIEGKIVGQNDKIATESEIIEKMKDLTGWISQLPPNYSAKKVRGRSAYKLAREGKKFELKPKDVMINSFELEEYIWPEISFRATVSSGTYIRTLTVDLARSLGTYATTVKLRRERIGNYNVVDAVKSNKFEVSLIEDNLIMID